MNKNGKDGGPSTSFADENFSDSGYFRSSCKTQNERHVLDFLYINIFIQQLLIKNITFSIRQKPTLIVNPLM